MSTPSQVEEREEQEAIRDRLGHEIGVAEVDLVVGEVDVGHLVHAGLDDGELRSAHETQGHRRLQGGGALLCRLGLDLRQAVVVQVTGLDEGLLDEVANLHQAASSPVRCGPCAKMSRRSRSASVSPSWAMNWVPNR